MGIEYQVHAKDIVDPEKCAAAKGAIRIKQCRPHAPFNGKTDLAGKDVANFFLKWYTGP